MHIDPLQTYTVSEVANLLSEDIDSTLKKIHSGDLPASNIGSGSQRPRWRILATDLASYLLNKQVAARSRPERRTRSKSPKSQRDFFE